MGQYYYVYAAVAALLVNQYNTAQTAKKRDRATAEGITRQGELARRANARTNEQLDQLALSSPDDEFATRSGQIRTQLRNQQKRALAGITTTGGGDAVTELAKKAGITATDFGDFIGENLSTIDAAGLQRQGEGFDRADTQNILNTLRRESGQQDFLTRLKVAGIKDNQLLSLLSTGLSAYAGTGGFNSGQTGGTVQASGSINQNSGALLPAGSTTNQQPGFGGFGVFGAGSENSIFKRLPARRS